MIRLCMFAVWFILLIAQPAEILSAFRAQKLCTYFDAADANGDGILSLADYQYMCDIVTSSLIYTGANAANCRTTIAPKAWKALSYGQSRQGDPVTKSQFMTYASGLAYTPQVDDALRNITLISNSFFNVDPETPMSMLVYASIFLIRGLNPLEAFASFRAIDLNHDNLISVDESVATLRTFIFGDDPSSPIQMMFGPLVPICVPV